jgi:hypothetical protein
MGLNFICFYCVPDTVLYPCPLYIDTSIMSSRLIWGHLAKPRKRRTRTPHCHCLLCYAGLQLSPRRAALAALKDLLLMLSSQVVSVLHQLRSKEGGGLGAVPCCAGPRSVALGQALCSAKLPYYTILYYTVLYYNNYTLL